MFTWSIGAILMGALFAFCPPSLMRGYERVKDKERELRNLVLINRVGGWFFYILGHIILILL